jgi:hypothetical protein
MCSPKHRRQLSNYVTLPRGETRTCLGRRIGRRALCVHEAKPSQIYNCRNEANEDHSLSYKVSRAT